MATPRVMILRAPGTNCDLETEFAFQQAGAVTDRIHVNRLIENPRVADPFQVLCLPGGFSYGDDIGAGRILAGQLRHHLADMLSSFRERKRLILGICNGFQVLIQTGMLVDQNFASDAQVTLAGNERGKFEDRWVALKVQPSPCVVLAGIERLYLPVAHAEGRFVTRDARVLDRLTARQQLRSATRLAIRPRTARSLIPRIRTVHMPTWRVFVM